MKKGIKDTVIYDEQMVEERFGFGPELLPDFKGLRGDVNFAWPSAEIAVMGPKGAVEIIFPRGKIRPNLSNTLSKHPKCFSIKDVALDIGPFLTHLG